MLKFLHIENIAVIEQSDIEFSDGLNVLTGETGAGKSIIIDSINAVLGERTSKELIRNGCSFGEVSALFGCLDKSVINILNEYGYQPDEDGNILIKRKLSNSGKGFIKLNDKPVTSSALKDICKNLINIHGQHDNQALLDPINHCMYIDAIAENSSIITDYYKEFKNLNSIRKELSKCETDADEKERKTEVLKYQINELEKADIHVGEINDLKKKLEISITYQKTYEALSRAYFLLKGNEDYDGAVTSLEEVREKLESTEREPFSSYCEKLSDINAFFDDICSEIGNFIDNAELRNINPDEINERLDLLYKLMLKYGNSEEKLIDTLENSKKELDEITFSEKRINELSDLLDESTNRLVKLGEKLTQSRKKAAEFFSKQVCDVLKYLDMPEVVFSVEIKKDRYTKTGCDNVEFFISANKGESIKPLHKIASGGELSRVMLAIKSALLDKDNVGTMIFDEIDTGISGFAAGKVGVQLKKVSKNRQVICVTHLAQIAAIANYHLLIKKSTNNGRTFTNVSQLSYNDRINEIARIMSGTEITENLYNSARELLDRSK